MDTSKEYIKMSDCPEIQEKWWADVGDFYFIRDRLCRPTNVVDVYDGKGYALLPRDANYGWLPRQDQIQEMMGDLLSKRVEYQQCCYCLVERAYRFADSDFCNLPIGSSMEQLWLAFYMWEKHKKIWGKNGWEDESSSE